MSKVKFQNNILLLFFLTFCLLSAQQDPAKKITLDHEVFLEELKNNENKIFSDILKKYDGYLSKKPNDILIKIEKCKFVQLAQYDEYEEYNPNQNFFDSISSSLLNNYPDHPDVLVYHTTLSWGETLDDIFEKAKKSIREKPKSWSDHNLGIIYSKIATKYYNEDNYETAHFYMEKAISYDHKYTSLITNTKILINLDKKEEAIASLKKDIDSITAIWELNQKASLFLELHDYSNALSIYNKINTIDSTFTNKAEIAKTLEEVGQHKSARAYLIKDTIKTWGKEQAMLNLFLHDLKYQNEDYCIESYNAYRDKGYTMDPLSIYRIKLFLSHPFLPWNMQDFLGLLTLFFIYILFIIIPSIWILPVYFIGHKTKIINKSTSDKFTWGLSSFWWLSSGYLIASFAALLVEPQVLSSWITWTENNTEIIDEQLGLSTLIFILVAAFFSFTILNKRTLKEFFPKYWTIGKSILIAIKYFILFKIVATIYTRIGIKVFDISIEDLTSISNIFLSTREDILALLSNYGNGVGYLLIGILVPIFTSYIVCYNPW